MKMKCVVCKKQIESFDLGGLEADGQIVLPHESNWHNGDVNKFYCGYGSSHDDDRFLVALCDDCITNRLDQNIIVKL